MCKKVILILLVMTSLFNYSCKRAAQQQNQAESTQAVQAAQPTIDTVQGNKAVSDQAEPPSAAKEESNVGNMENGQMPTIVRASEYTFPQNAEIFYQKLKAKKYKDLDGYRPSAVYTNRLPNRQLPVLDGSYTIKYREFDIYPLGNYRTLVGNKRACIWDKYGNCLRDDRGEERIVIGYRDGDNNRTVVVSAYYTDDHYKNFTPRDHLRL